MAVCGGIKVQCTQNVNNNKIHCAILGLGNQAFEHLQASINLRDIAIVAGVDRDKVRWEKAIQAFPDLRLQCFADLVDLQASGLQIDAFILALPHHVYGGIWPSLMQWGKPLLKQKPLGRDYQEAKDFMQQSRTAECGLQTAIQRRQHPSYKFLANYLKQHKLTPTEIHAHLHLGKGQENPDAAFDLGWRGDRRQAGGGALLDAGYHLIDLVQFLIGDFDVISATMWDGSKADNGQDIEDRSWLTGCSSETWLMVDTWVKGESNNNGGYLKSEKVSLKTSQGVLSANREGVWLGEQKLFSSDREWQHAMQQQLADFARCIATNNWQNDVIWDQLPAMRKIEEAYRLSSRY